MSKESLIDNVILRNKATRVQEILDVAVQKFTKEFGEGSTLPPLLVFSDALTKELAARREKALSEMMRHLDVGDLYLAMSYIAKRKRDGD
jgi:hypothetical protein